MNKESELVKVGFTYLPVINFALQQNRVPVVRLFSIENISGDTLNNIHVKLFAEPEFCNAVPYVIETLPADETVRITDLRVTLSVNFFIQLTERLAGNISLVISADDKVVFREDYPVDMLTFDQWSGISVLPEMLSAFITPNYPSVSRIQKRAAEILEQMTGSPALDAYQSRNPNRVKAQMAAIYNAIAEQQIIYSSVPASFEQRGQRVRMVDNVMSQKLGTCLDMALLYASCLEAAGIHPLIIITKGHAFAGAWLIADTFPDSVIDDYSYLTKRTAEGINEIILMEATLMNKGNDLPFDESVKLANDNMRKTGDFVLAIDVKRSRFSGIRPLPQRMLNGEQWEIKEEEDVVVEKEIISPQAVNPYDLSNLSAEIEVTRQLVWERKLLDLSLRNNLLNTRITKNTLQLISADLDKFEDALADGSEFRFMPKPADWDNPLQQFGVYDSIASSDPVMELVKAEIVQKKLRTYLTETELDRSLKHLYRSSKLSIEENGANTLYLALGLLRWYETPSSERPRYAPILLLPVEMIRKSTARGYVVRSREEDAMLNITLLEMLRQNFGVNVPGLELLPQDESGVNVRLIYSIFRESIKNQPKWDVEEQAILGIFSFNKFIMWNDIHNNADRLMENKLVNSLVEGKITFDVDDNMADASDLDSSLTPADIVLPISADSSQLEAVYEALNDRTYILHGPPGTGKSQTITNIIANALYHGKRVLFVAEKMAALSVVQSRLEAIGLAPFCLELHSNKTKKTSVLSQLKAATEVVRQRSPENFSRDAQRLFDIRKELNKYVMALHKPYPFGLSLYQAMTHYLHLTPDREVEFPASLLGDMNDDKLLEWQDALDLLVSVGNAFGHPYSHPLTGINIDRYYPELKEKTSEALNEAIRVVTDFQSDIAVLRSITGDSHDVRYSKEQIEAARTLYSALLQIPELTPALLCEQKPAETIAEGRETVIHGKERDRYKAEILNTFTESILDIEAKVLLNEWNLTANRWILARYLGRKKMRNQLATHIHNGSIKQVDIKNILILIIKYQNEQKFVSAHSEKLPLLFGQFAKPGREQWEQVQQMIDDFSSIDDVVLTLAKDPGRVVVMKEHLARQLEAGIEAFRKMHGKALSAFVARLTELDEAVSKVSGLLEIDSDYLKNEEHTWMEDTLSQFNRWLAGVDMLKDWYQWLLARRKAEQSGIGFAADAYKANNISTNQLKDSFDKGFYRAAISYIIAREPELELFKGKMFNDVISKYKEMTDSFMEITREELYAKLASNIPSFTMAAVQNSEVGILQRNIKNNGRGTSIRSLFDQIPTLLSRMCPCMLMSPISVAQYISHDSEKFDMIVFDEASQMPTCEAVGAIARAKNMIIVGDPKQMPPTNFFTVNTVDEENIDKEDLESILDDSLALSIPSRYLLWHYRSKHESLITFSNREYYDNKLLTFPSPDNIESKVRMVHIEGFYDKGKSRQNLQEAKAVVEEIERRLSDNTLREKSIGVVTFSSAQQNLVEDVLSDLFIKRPDLEVAALECEEPLFIKNLENVQGDERDVILFSVGYGPDAEGRVSMNFGPLNREGGERRLNVAVSRARYEMIIFSSLQSDQIDMNRTSAVGVAGLKRFLEFAEKGERLNRVKRENAMGKVSIEHLIAARLKEAGYEVHTNVGASGYKIDIAIVDENDPDKYLLGIICDGDNYKRAKTTRDREIVQTGVLGILGWNICRVWTLDWWENAGEVLNTINSAIENARNKTAEMPVAESKSMEAKAINHEERLEKHDPADAATEDDADKTETDGKQEQYVYALLPAAMAPSESFMLPGNKDYIIRQILTVIEAEAPISRSLLCKRVLSSWGITRLGSRLDAHFDELLLKTGCYQKTDDQFAGIWKSEGQMASYSVFRPYSERTAPELPPEEVANAVRSIVEAQISLPTKDLARMTAQLFGFARMGNNVDTAMYMGIREAVRRGYIKVETGRAIIL